MDTLNVVEPNLDEPRTFAKPHALKKDERTGYMVIDPDRSELGVCMGALGRPNVYYMAKANRYYKDPNCTNLYTDVEIQALGLPIPIEIEGQRKKLIERAQREGKFPKEDEILTATLPQVVKPPDHINQRIAQMDPTERMIQRINRSSMLPK